jgi:uncharacterized protein
MLFASGKRMLVVFVVLTFAMTWSLWLACAALADITGFGIGGPIFLLGVFAPAFVAIALTALNEGKQAVGSLLARIGRWQVPIRLYAFALSYMAVIKLLAAAVQRITLGRWPPFGDSPLLLMIGGIALSTWTQAGEEVGWRGYALAHVAQRTSLGTASLIVGVIWAFWHLPLFVIAATGSTGQSFPIYLLHVTALSVAMTWLYWKSGGSLLLVMLMHAAVNNTTQIVPAALPESTSPFRFNGSFVAWATVVLSWASAIVLLWQMRHGDATTVAVSRNL